MSLLLLLALLPLDLASPPPAAAHRAARPSLTIQLRASIAAIRDGAEVAIEIRHHFEGPTPERFLEGDRGACAGPQDYLLVDGVARSLATWQACNGPWLPQAEEIAPGGGWVSRGEIVLAPGRHRLRAVYHVEDRSAALLERADNMILFRGDARSPELVIDVPPVQRQPAATPPSG